MDAIAGEGLRERYKQVRYEPSEPMSSPAATSTATMARPAAATRKIRIDLDS